MKKCVNKLIVLAAFSWFCSSWAMEEQSGVDVVEHFSAECDWDTLPSEMQEFIFSFIIKSGDLSEAILLYDIQKIRSILKAHGILRSVSMGWRNNLPDFVLPSISNPEEFIRIFNEGNLPSSFLQKFSLLMVKESKKADIFSDLFIDFYTKLEVKKSEDRVKGKLFLNNFAREVQYLLCEHFSEEIENDIKRRDRKLRVFVWNIVRSADLKWLCQLRQSLAARSTKYVGSNSYRIALERIIRDIDLRAYVDAIGISSEEKQEYLKSENCVVLDSSNEELAGFIVAEVLGEKTDSMANFRESLQGLDGNERNKIIDYIWTNYINVAESPFIGKSWCFTELFKLLFSDEKNRMDAIGYSLEKISRHYPKTIEIFYITSDASPATEFIKHLFNSVSSCIQKKIVDLLVSEDELVSDEVVRNFFEAGRKFGFRFIVELCEELLLDSCRLIFRKNKPINSEKFFLNLKNTANSMKQKFDFPVYEKLGEIVLGILETMEIPDREDAGTIFWKIRGDFADLK